MNLIRRALDLDPDTDARLRALAAERGQDEGRIVAEAVALLNSMVDVADLDVAEDLRRLESFRQSGEAVTAGAMRAWIESWDTPDELPPPKPQQIE